MLIKTNSRFVGKALLHVPEKEKRIMVLDDDFAFIDSKGFEWLVPKETVVDGSSIPWFLWSLMGSPFVGLHRLASIPHDHYCVTKSEPHKNVHKMYFEACRLNGVSNIMAKTYYRGIKLGGPKWET